MKLLLMKLRGVLPAQGAHFRFEYCTVFDLARLRARWRTNLAGGGSQPPSMEEEDDDDFAEVASVARALNGRKRSLPPSSNGLQQNPVTIRRICELGRLELTHQQISATLHEEGLLNSKGVRWARATDGKVIERVLRRNDITLQVAVPPEASATHVPDDEAIRGGAAAPVSNAPTCQDAEADDDDGMFDMERETTNARRAASAAPASRSARPSAAVPTSSAASVPAAQAVAPRGQLQAAVCVLCSGPFAATGRHQPCSLACGHIFGRSCITSHLFRHKSCSLCGATARRSCIRPLYAIAQALPANTGDEPAAASAVEVQTRAEDALCERLEQELSDLHAELYAVQQRTCQLQAASILGSAGRGTATAAAAPAGAGSFAIGARAVFAPVAANGPHVPVASTASPAGAEGKVLRVAPPLERAFQEAAPLPSTAGVLAVPPAAREC